MMAKKDQKPLALAASGRLASCTHQSNVLRVLGLLATLLFAYGAVAAEPAQPGDSPTMVGLVTKEPKRLPVYQVIKSGATPTEAEKLARHLGISAKNLLSEDGAISFVDTTRYLATPRATLAASPLLEKTVAATRNKDKSRIITPAVLDSRAFGDLHVLSESAAVSKTAAAFEAAGLTPQFAAASSGHHELSLYSKNGEKGTVSKLPIDTEVTYRFTDPNGYPIYGPGAEVQVTYDAESRVSRIFYAARRLKVATTVAVIPQAEANEQIARLMPPNSTVVSRVVYFAPPLSNSENARVAQLIPWYAYYATRTITNPQTGASFQVKSKIGFIPATKDSR